MTPREEARLVLASMPCSIELPAGAGKTETIATIVHEASVEGKRTLLLTHTHAGVDVLRRRIRRQGVRTEFVTIRTLDSWCFDLISSFPLLAGIMVDPEPDWKQSRNYHEAGARAISSDAVVRMLSASYDLLLVDEYQDCQLWQHSLVVAVSQVIPTAALGDRMQGLFFFNDAQPVEWSRDVMRDFPALTLSVSPWRWHRTNPALGTWLLSVRRSLLHGQAVDLAAGPVVRAAPGDRQTYFDQPRHPSTVVAISAFPNSAALLASQLGGSYTMVEEIEGRHLKQYAAAVDSGDADEVAFATIGFAASCAFGVAEYFTAERRSRYSDGKGLNPNKAGDFANAVDVLNVLRRESTLRNVQEALHELARLPRFRLYRREAWFGVLEALRLAEATPGLKVYDAVVSIRNKLRATGRRPESHVVARPLLIKGLEFEHAVIDRPDKYNAHELYVCLTRGATSVTLLTDARYLRPRRPGLGQ